MSILTQPSASIQDVPENTQAETPPAVDANIHAFISDTYLEAYLNIEPPSNGGAVPTLKGLETALADLGVSYQYIDVKKLQELSDHPIYSCDIVVARGIAPVDGMDGTATFHIDTAKKIFKPKENDDGIVDYHDLGIVENVEKGQVLCTITPPTEGNPGMSVKGKEMPQKKGKQAPSYVGKNTELDQNATAILSKIDGQVDYSGRKINVNETFYVKENVDNSTGDIKVVGNLVIRGMISPGFKVEAGNNIEVAGTVSSATLKAGGSIKLQGGITGSELHCEGDLKSRFIENCNLFVKGNIRADYVLNSNIKCGKSLKTEGSIAKIIGGRCLAGQNIEAHYIGSAANVKTSLEVGTDPIILDRQQELQAKIPELEKQIGTLKPLLKLLRDLGNSNRLTSEKAELLNNVTNNYNTASDMLENARRDLEEIAQTVYNRGYGRVICTGTIFPGTKVTIGTASLSVSEPLINTSLYYSKGDVCIGFAR